MRSAAALQRAAWLWRQAALCNVGRWHRHVECSSKTAVRATEFTKEHLFRPRVRVQGRCRLEPPRRGCGLPAATAEDAMRRQRRRCGIRWLPKLAPAAAGAASAPRCHRRPNWTPMTHLPRPRMLKGWRWLRRQALERPHRPVVQNSDPVWLHSGSKHHCCTTTTCWTIPCHNDRDKILDLRMCSREGCDEGSTCGLA